jgi:hypothetical protein
VTADRDAWLLAADGVLLAQCAVDTYRASGPGGQHRNKTESAVRLRHKPSGLVAHGDESRSQAENKARALKRLREHLALDLRLELPADGWVPSVRLARMIAGGTAPLGERTRQTTEYLAAMAELLDVVAAAGAEVAASAARLGITTGAMSKLLTHDDRVLRAVNRMRQQHELRPLR